MSARNLAIVAMLAALAACEGARDLAPEDTEPASNATPLSVVLGPTEQRKLGIEMVELAGATFAPSIEGPAHVVDAQTVIAVMAELDRAQAAARASAAAAARARDLFNTETTVSAETLEAAERQAATDAAALRVAQAQAVLRYGNEAPWLDTNHRSELLAALANGTTALVSASFPARAGVEPVPFELQRIGAAPGDAHWVAAEPWRGPADPTLPGPTLLGLVEASQGLSIGERLTAHIATGERLTGVVVPITAVVLSGAEPWCYVRSDEEVFIRRRVALDQPLAAGYFQADGFETGERVVVAGAGLLLAHEIGDAAAED